MGWKALAMVLLVAACHSARPPTSYGNHALQATRPARRVASAACERVATQTVDGLVDHYAGQGELVWDALYAKLTLPQATFGRTKFAAFLLTSDGKHWLRSLPAFESFYRGVLQHCEETGA